MFSEFLIAPTHFFLFSLYFPDHILIFSFLNWISTITKNTALLSSCALISLFFFSCHVLIWPTPALNKQRQLITHWHCFNITHTHPLPRSQLHHNFLFFWQLSSALVLICSLLLLLPHGQKWGQSVSQFVPMFNFR